MEQVRHAQILHQAKGLTPAVSLQAHKRPKELWTILRRIGSKSIFTQQRYDTQVWIRAAEIPHRTHATWSRFSSNDICRFYLFTLTQGLPSVQLTFIKFITIRPSLKKSHKKDQVKVKDTICTQTFSYDSTGMKSDEVQPAHCQTSTHFTSMKHTDIWHKSSTKVEPV